METAERVADLSERILNRVAQDDLEEALRLVLERGEILRRLTASGPHGADVEEVVRRAVSLGDQALEALRPKAEDLRRTIERVDQGRAGMSAYRPGGAGANSLLDTSR